MTDTHNCLVLDMRLDGRGRPFGKHETHPSHLWWYTSFGGGHQLAADWEPDGIRYSEDRAFDSVERYVTKYLCPGRD